MICSGLAHSGYSTARKRPSGHWLQPLAIAIVKSSARIRLELFSDHSALVAKTREDHGTRDLTFRTLDPTKTTRKIVLALWPLNPSRLLPANDTRAVGCNKPNGRAHEEKVRKPFTHTLVSANARLRLYNTGPRPHAPSASVKAGLPPASVA